jgi:hypothetical protein
MKQTAVEWLVSHLNKQEWFTYKQIEYIEQAKEMEKQQIIDAHNNGKNILPPNENGKQYYNQTFKEIENL